MNKKFRWANQPNNSVEHNPKLYNTNGNPIGHSNNQSQSKSLKKIQMYEPTNSPNKIQYNGVRSQENHNENNDYQHNPLRNAIINRNNELHKYNPSVSNNMTLELAKKKYRTQPKPSLFGRLHKSVYTGIKSARNRVKQSMFGSQNNKQVIKSTITNQFGGKLLKTYKKYKRN